MSYVFRWLPERVLAMDAEDFNLFHAYAAGRSAGEAVRWKR